MVKAAIYSNPKIYTEDDVQAAVAAMFLKLLINLVSNEALFAIVYKAFMVLPNTLSKTSNFSLTPRSMCCAIGLSTKEKLPAHSVNGPFFTKLKKSSGRSPLQNGTISFSKARFRYLNVNEKGTILLMATTTSHAYWSQDGEGAKTATTAKASYDVGQF